MADFRDIDPWEAAVTSVEANATVSGGGQADGNASSPVKERVLKMSALVDQADDSEPRPPSRDQVDLWMGAYVTIMGSPPSEEEEPSEAQLAALHKKVFLLKGPPYADLAIFTPFEGSA